MNLIFIRKIPPEVLDEVCFYLMVYFLVSDPFMRFNEFIDGERWTSCAASCALAKYLFLFPIG